MTRMYDMRVLSDKVMIGRIVPDNPKKTWYYMIGDRDLFAAIQAMDMMGVFDRTLRPGHIVQLRLTEDDIKAVDRRANERPEEAADQEGG